MVVRVLVPGLTDRQVCEHVLKALKDPDCESFVVHKRGSRFSMPDGREVIVTAAGEFQPAELTGSC